MAKNTYGTGNFMLANTGNEPRLLRQRPATTVASQDWRRSTRLRSGRFGRNERLPDPVAARQDNLRMIEHAAESEELATSVKDSGGCYVVPAFSGLFAPHWRSDARGVIVGLTRYVNRAHIVRAALEANRIPDPRGSGRNER